MSVFDQNNLNQKQNLNLSQIQLQNLNSLTLLNTYDKYMYLKLYIDDSDDLKNKYINSAVNHNNKILDPNNLFLDAGFDLFNPIEKSFNVNNVLTINKIDHNVCCSAQMVTDTNKVYNTGFYMYPRSSLSKTKLRLANSTGIIDSGYRGHLIGMFDLLAFPNKKYDVEQYDRLLQICAPGLVPIVVEIVNTFEELGNQTERGVGGFGSTGR
jgi:dUTP pyrophosphatase